MANVENIHSDDAGKWKQKFLANLDKLDDQEQLHEQESVLLKESISKVCIAAQGQDSDLDLKLSRLRKLLRSSNSDNDHNSFLKALNVQLKALESQLVTFDDVRRQRIIHSVRAFNQIISQLNHNSPSKSVSKKLDKLRAQVDSCLDSDITPDITAWIESLGKLQGEVLKSQMDTDVLPTTSKPGFWARLFGIAMDGSTAIEGVQKNISDQAEDQKPLSANYEGMQSEDITAEPATLEQGGLTNDEINPGTSYNRSSAEPASSLAIDMEVNAILLSMLDLASPETSPELNNEEQISGLRKTLKRHLAPQELVPILERLNKLLAAAVKRYEIEFESFLKNLDNRLLDVSKHLSSTQDLQKEVFLETDKLDQEVRDQVKHMNQDLEQATDLTQLKDSVRKNIEHIVSSMDTFKEVNRHQDVSLAEQLNSLVDRVASMEQESNAAHEQLAKQREQIFIDHLTKLPNRGAYDQRIIEEYAHWQRYHRPLTLAVGDIDLFKRINDNYGHSSGDKVLQVIAKKLVKRLRQTDFVARYGGEEFVLLLPETDVEKAINIMEQIRETIADTPFQFRDEKLQVTMSFGISEFKGENTASQIFDQADQALYKAKEGGRNCCMVANNNA